MKGIIMDALEVTTVIVIFILTILVIAKFDKKKKID